MLVVLIIAAVLVLLMSMYVSVKISYVGGELNYIIRYSFFRIYSGSSESTISKRKPVKKKKNYSVQSSKKKSEDLKKTETDVHKREKPSLDQRLEKIRAVIDFITSSEKYIFNAVSKISFSDIFVDFTVADADACDCAVRFGMINAAVYNILGFISAYFKTKIKNVNIGIKYNDNNSIYDMGLSVRLRLGTAVAASIGILFEYFIKGPKKSNLSAKKNEEKLTEESLNMSDHPVNGLMGTTIEKIREMIDVNTIIGNPISTPDGATIIPVSKVSFGFASGGSDLPVKQPKSLFGGAAGAGVSIQPLAFICVSNTGETKLLQMSVNASKENAIINTIPELIDKISDMINSKDKEKEGKSKKEKSDDAE